MTWAKLIFQIRSMSLTVLGTMILMGLLAWFTMPREEDPKLKERFGLITVVYPGSSAPEVERLVVEPIEDEISRVDEVFQIDTTIQAESAVFDVRLADHVSKQTDIDQAWDEVIAGIEKAQEKFPEGVEAPQLNRRLLDLESIVIAIGGGNSVMERYDRSRVLEKRLRSLTSVSDVRFIGDPGEQINIEVNEAALIDSGLNWLQLSSSLESANQANVSGSVKQGRLKFNVRANTEFESLDDIRNFSIALESGSSLRLGEIAKVYRGPRTPYEMSMRHQGQDVIGLGVIAKPRVDLLALGEKITTLIQDFNNEDPRFPTSIVTAQPDYVSSRLNNLAVNLGSGIAIVASILFIIMGIRMGLIVSGLIPLICLASLALYSFLGGVLHQISIAAFILALGMLVDNVIVVIEGVQEKLDQGLDRLQAVLSSIKEFTFPLAAATGTTIAAFLPMLGASGVTADFTRAIPTVVIITLLVSFAFSVFATPVVAHIFLKARKQKNDLKPCLPKLQKLFDQLSTLAIGHPKKTLAIAGLLVLLSLSLFPLLKLEFFPKADRNQLVVEMKLEQGSHFHLTQEAAEQVEDTLRTLEGVESVSTFVGRSVPTFYYNLQRIPRAPHVSQILVVFDSAERARLAKPTIEALGDQFQLSEYRVLELEQGPPIKAPIELLVKGDRSEELSKYHSKIKQVFKGTPGTRDVRDENGLPVKTLRYVVQDNKASEYFVGRDAIGLALMSRTQGIPVGSYRAENESMPIRLLSRNNSSKKELSQAELEEALVRDTRTGRVSVADLANLSERTQESVIYHYNLKKTMRVLSDIDENYSMHDVLSDIQLKLQSLKLPPSIELQLKGAQAESGSANEAMAKAAPLGVLLLLLSLLALFNSYKKVGIILASVPLAIVGVTPGLILTGTVFSFFSLLASMALIGIVVNNAILLVDYIDTQLKNGVEMDDALSGAVQRRFRPILLTTLTTAAGMLPLALTDATLWPPFARTLIFGLLVSTGLTLFFVPALYKLVFQRAMPLVLLLCSSFLHATTAPTSEIQLLMESSKNSAKALSLRQQTLIAKQNENEQWRKTYLPRAGLTATQVFRSNQLSTSTPTGELIFQEDRQLETAFQIEQTVLNLSQQLGARRAAEEGANAQVLLSEHQQQEHTFENLNLYFDALEKEARWLSLQKLESQLKKRQSEAKRLFQLGRLNETILLEIEIKLDETTLSREHAFALNRRLLNLLSRRTNVPIEKIFPTEFSKIDANIRPFQPRTVIENPLLQSFSSLESSAQNEARAIRLSYIPTLKIFGRYVYNNPGLFNENSWSEGGLSLEWQLFDGYTRKNKQTKAKLKALQARYEQQHQQEVLLSQIDLATALLDDANKKSERLRKNLRKALKAVELERERFQEGRISINDLLDAEELSLSIEERLNLSRVQKLRAWNLHQLSTGRLGD